MKILWIEDTQMDIYGMEAQCEAREWQKEVVDNFCDAIKKLSDTSNKYDLVIIDLMLPWGNEVPDEIITSFTDETVGIRLLEAMRGCCDGRDILEKIGIPPIFERHSQTPVIVLTKFPQHEESCQKLGNVHFFCKRSYRWQSLLAAMEGYAHA